MRRTIARLHPLVSALCIAGMLIVIWLAWISPLPSHAGPSASVPGFLSEASPGAVVSGPNRGELNLNPSANLDRDEKSRLCTPEWTPAVNLEYEQRVIELVNTERSLAGLPPLKSSPALIQSARYHASDMGNDGYFGHDTKDWSEDNLLMICSYRIRIGNAYPGGQWVGENIAKGYPSPESVVAAWMNSEIHRDNILNKRFWEIGAGYYHSTGADNQEYWALDFGKSSNRFPLIINSEANITDMPQVVLYIFGDWKEMRLRNDSGSWTKWQPFLNSMDWKLPDAPGEHTVTVELRSGNLRSSSSDTIQLVGDGSRK